MEFTAKQIADALHGTVEGNPDARVNTFAKIEHGKPGAISFYANPKYEQYVYTSRASVLLVNSDFAPKQKVEPTMVRVENAYSALADLLKFVVQQRRKYRRHRGLSTLLLGGIACSARLGKKVWVGDFVKIGARSRIGDYGIIKDNVSIGSDVVIGNNVLIYPGVVIYPKTVIGNNCILHAGCVVGSDGFGNAPQPDGTWQKIEHLGGVIIGDNVEVGSNSTIDRAEMENTVIGNGVRIDNLCQIAHNVVIGDNTVMAAQTGIAGSAEIGKNCILAGQVGVVGHIKIADNTIMGAQSGVTRSVRKSGTVLLGSPAIEHSNYLKSYAKFKQAGTE